MTNKSNDKETRDSFWRAWRFGTEEGYNLPKRIINELNSNKNGIEYKG